MADNSVKIGGITAGAGCLFGLAPLIISFAAAAVGSDIGNGLHWYTFFTAPVGAVFVIIGLIMAIVGASRKTPEEFAKTVSTVSDDDAARSATAKEKPVAPATLPPLPASLARWVKLAYAIGFGVVLVSCVMRVTLFQPLSGIMTFFDMVPVVFAAWFVFLARNAQDGLQFLRLHQSQMIVSIAGCVVGLYPLVYLSDDISMLIEPNVDGLDKFQWGGTVITGLIPPLASIASLIFAGIVRARYRASIAKS
jgi:hypothetical protein